MGLKKEVRYASVPSLRCRASLTHYGSLAIAHLALARARYATVPILRCRASLTLRASRYRPPLTRARPSRVDPVIRCDLWRCNEFRGRCYVLLFQATGAAV